MTLDPRARALLDLIARAQVPPFHLLDVARARAEFRKMQRAFGAEPPVVRDVRDLDIDLPGRSIRGRLYAPRGGDESVTPPLLLFFHGGGWVIGDLDSYDALCRQLSSRAGCVVLSVDYRLAPEHPFPAAVEDAFDALRWAFREARRLGGDPARIAVAGDSAGGNLATVASLMARDAGGPRLGMQVLIYPSVDQAHRRDSRLRYAEGYLLDRPSIEWFQNKYLSGQAQWDDWRASPLLAPDLAGLPPTLMITAGFDPLRDDDTAYVERLRQAGVPTEHVCYGAMIHGFVTLGRLFPQADAAVELIAARLKSAYPATA